MFFTDSGKSYCSYGINASSYDPVFSGIVAQLVKNLLAMRETWVGQIPWRRETLLTPVFWPGEFHAVYSPWGHKESDMTERLSLHSENK